MMPYHIPARIPSKLRHRAITHRRLALAALHTDRPASFRLSRYWAHVDQARALEALERAQKPSTALGLGGVK